LTGELFLVVVGAIIVILSVLTWKKYPVLTKEGFLEIIFGFIAFTLHFLFDGLDTIATASEDYYEALYDSTMLPEYLELATSFSAIHGTFDFLDGLFTIIGLLLIVIGILRIAAYGKQLWGE
jgi:hypothetical protein